MSMRRRGSLYNEVQVEQVSTCLGAEAVERKESGTGALSGTPLSTRTPSRLPSRKLRMLVVKTLLDIEMIAFLSVLLERTHTSALTFKFSAEKSTL